MKIEVQASQLELSEGTKDAIERRIHLVLNKFSGSIRSIRMLMRMDGGPGRVYEKRCKIEARLQPKGKIVVDANDINPTLAVSKALDRVARRVKDHFELKRDRRRRKSHKSNDVLAA